ncbi:MAG: hypothetical protein ABI317_05730, partial [Gaiellales bacterium]
AWPFALSPRWINPAIFNSSSTTKMRIDRSVTASDEHEMTTRGGRGQSAEFICRSCLAHRQKAALLSRHEHLGNCLRPTHARAPALADGPDPREATRGRTNDAHGRNSDLLHLRAAAYVRNGVFCCRARRSLAGGHGFEPSPGGWTSDGMPFEIQREITMIPTGVGCARGASCPERRDVVRGLG